MYGYSRAAIYGVDHEYTTFFCLFQLAGAAQSLGAGAILVNPRNISDVAIAIKDALDMTEGYREECHRHNYEHVTTHTAQVWADTFVRYKIIVFY